MLTMSALIPPLLLGLRGEWIAMVVTISLRFITDTSGVDRTMAQDSTTHATGGTEGTEEKRDLRPGGCAIIPDGSALAQAPSRSALHEFDEDPTASGGMQEGDEVPAGPRVGTGSDDGAAGGGRPHEGCLDVGNSKGDVVEPGASGGQKLCYTSAVIDRFEEFKINRSGRQEGNPDPLPWEGIPFRHLQAEGARVQAGRLGEITHRDSEVVTDHACLRSSSAAA